MRNLLYVENSSEIDRREVYLCPKCLGVVSFQKPDSSRKYVWFCNSCWRECSIEELKIKIGEKVC